MDQLRNYAQQNSGMLTTIIFVVIACVILYVVYTYLYPSDDPSYVQFLQGETDARKPITLAKNGVTPSIFTGGDFTLSFWIYIDDWNYKNNRYKLLFNIAPEQGDSILVGMLTPLQNNMIVRANSGTPVDPVLKDTARKNLLSGAAGPMENKMCDTKDIPLQRWTCVTIVSSGRTLDVYNDGKLQRSCILSNNLDIPIRQKLRLHLGEFGGRYSSVQMWNQQITPDVIYGIYMMGPTQTQHNIFTDISKFLGINVTFTGSVPGKKDIEIKNPFDEMQGDACSVMQEWS